MTSEPVPVAEDGSVRALAPLRLDVVAPVRVHMLGLACCALECEAATERVRRAGPPGAAPGPAALAPGPAALPADAADVLVVAGTVTDRVAADVRGAYDALLARGGRCAVVSFGACATSGGPYWDSHVVTKGIDQLLPVDVYVPGCPPRPEALLEALAALTDETAGRAADPAAPAGGGRP